MNNIMGNFYNAGYPYYTYPQSNFIDHNMVHGLMSCRCNKSYLRVLNTYNSQLDFQINEIIITENLKKGEFTKYAQFAPGTYEVKIFKSEEPKKLIFESIIDINRNLAYTGVIVRDDDDHTDISVLMIPDAKENAISGKMTDVRFTNVAIDAPELELATSDGVVLFSGINYGNVSNNVTIPSGRYTLLLREKATKKILKEYNIDFAPRMHYSLFATGNYKENPDIKIIVPEDGVNYLELC